jgi:hypothetical protein
LQDCKVELHDFATKLVIELFPGAGRNVLLMVDAPINILGAVPFGQLLLCEVPTSRKPRGPFC